jgi:hypothetical protein
MGIKEFQCVDCGNQFRNKPSLKQPVAITHLGQEEFQCQECGKSITRVSSLKVPNLTHTNEIPYRCEFCIQGIKEKRNLIKHIEKQHPNAFIYNIEQMKSNSTNEHTRPSAETDVDENNEDVKDPTSSTGIPPTVTTAFVIPCFCLS